MKTPIEQLIEDLIKHDLIKADGFTTTLMLKAKQVEKEEIINAWDNGFSNGFDLGRYEEDCKTDDGEQYIKDTFKKTNDETI
jgi:uncharacterized protein YgfB (UPF0149 family)